MRGESPCLQVGKGSELSLTCLSCVQAYFAIAEGLKQDAILKAAKGRALKELMSDIDPRMTVAHCTLKREECGVGIGALQDQLESIVSSDAPLEQRLQDSYDIIYPWVPQLVGKMPPVLQAMYYGTTADLLHKSKKNVGERDASDQ